MSFQEGSPPGLVSSCVPQGEVWEDGSFGKQCKAS